MFRVQWNWKIVYFLYESLLNFSFPVSFFFFLFFFLLVVFLTNLFFTLFAFISLIEHIRPKNIQIKAKPNSSNSFYFSVPLLDVVVFLLLLLLLLLWCECRTNELREKKKSSSLWIFWTFKMNSAHVEFQNSKLTGREQQNSNKKGSHACKMSFNTRFLGN